MDVWKLSKIIIIALYFIMFKYSIADAKHLYCEAAYQYEWCSQNNGQAEYINADKTRVDCLTQKHAVEFDFAQKWAESVGQALYYGNVTGKRPMVVLILENPKRQMSYYNRVLKLSKIYNFDVEYVTTDIFKSNEKNYLKYCKR